jgi:hypothetical protein
MKGLTQMVLISEIVNQSKIASVAARRLDKSGEPEETWEAIQSLLVAAANVSKILKPVRKKYNKNRKLLRDSLGVSDDCLLLDRTFRDHFEHYDERIEEWIEGGNSGTYMDSRIDPIPSQFSQFQFCHRSYNPTTKVLSFRGKDLNLDALLNELTGIRVRCGF